MIEIKPNPAIIETLEILLEEAKRGELLSIAYAAGYPGQKTMSGWNGMYMDNVKMIGELQILQRDIIDLCIDTRVNVMTGEIKE